MRERNPNRRLDKPCLYVGYTVHTPEERFAQHKNGVHDAPIVRAFEEGNRFADEFPNAATTASGLRVPKAIGDFLILDALRASGGTAVSVTDEELIAATREIGAAEGIFCAPEGAACLPALRKLMETGEVRHGERVVLFNTGSGVKYMESFSKAD